MSAADTLEFHYNTQIMDYLAIWQHFQSSSQRGLGKLWHSAWTPGAVLAGSTTLVLCNYIPFYCHLIAECDFMSILGPDLHHCDCNLQSVSPSSLGVSGSLLGPIILGVCSP